MDKYLSNVCISSSPFPRFPYFDLRRAVTGTSYSRGKNCTSQKRLLCMMNLSTMLYMIPMLNTIYSGMSGRGALLNSSMLHLVSVPGHRQTR